MTDLFLYVPMYNASNCVAIINLSFSKIDSKDGGLCKYGMTNQGPILDCKPEGKEKLIIFSLFISHLKTRNSASVIRYYV